MGTRILKSDFDIEGFLLAPTSPVPPLTTSPVPPLTTSPVPPLTTSPVPPLTTSPVPPLTTSPVPPLTTSPVPPLTTSPVPPLTTSPVPPRDEQRANTNMDMKPNNLLIGPTGELKIADFGFARLFGSPDRKLTHQVFALWYRAPELLFGSKAYGSGVDVWGAGCVFAELLLRRPFLQGSSDIDQLGKIFAALGTPREDQWPDMQCLPDYVHFNFCPAPPLKSHFPMAGDDALDLLSRMLTFDPNKRITAAQALQHRHSPFKSCFPMAGDGALDLLSCMPAFDPEDYGRPPRPCSTGSLSCILSPPHPPTTSCVPCQQPRSKPNYFLHGPPATKPKDLPRPPFLYMTSDTHLPVIRTFSPLCPLISYFLLGPPATKPKDLPRPPPKPSGSDFPPGSIPVGLAPIAPDAAAAALDAANGTTAGGDARRDGTAGGAGAAAGGANTGRRHLPPSVESPHYPRNLSPATKAVRISLQPGIEDSEGGDGRGKAGEIVGEGRDGRGAVEGSGAEGETPSEVTMVTAVTGGGDGAPMSVDTVVFPPGSVLPPRPKLNSLVSIFKHGLLGSGQALSGDVREDTNVRAIRYKMRTLMEVNEESPHAGTVRDMAADAMLSALQGEAADADVAAENTRRMLKREKGERKDEGHDWKDEGKREEGNKRKDEENKRKDEENKRKDEENKRKDEENKRKDEENKRKDED
ncbi:unnamed protein product [Closterium sp. NIES-64]|nr:unnamed protein product [Closterium sp. NIES-64]